jgi:hypothetical protein
VRESRLAVQTKGQNAPGDAYGWLRRLQSGSVRRTVFLKKLFRRRRPIKFVWVGLVPARLDLGKLFLALLKLVDWLKR